MKVKLQNLLCFVLMFAFVFSLPIIFMYLYPNPNNSHYNIKFPEPVDYQNNYVKFYDI